MDGGILNREYDALERQVLDKSCSYYGDRCPEHNTCIVTGENVILVFHFILPTETYLVLTKSGCLKIPVKITRLNSSSNMILSNVMLFTYNAMYLSIMLVQLSMYYVCS